MISLIRKRELLDKYIEAEKMCEPLIEKSVISKQQADQLLFDYLHQPEFTQEECRWMLNQLGIVSEGEDADRLLPEMIELLIQMDSVHGEPVIHLKIYPNLTGKIINEEGESLVCYESFEDCISKMKDFINNNGWNNLTDEEYAVIAAIRAEPNYEFKQEEKKLAYSMVDKNMLEQVTENVFSVTEYGNRLFEQIKFIFRH